MIRYRKSMRDALGEVRGLIEDATTSYPPKEINKKKHDSYTDPKKGEKKIVESDPSIDDIAKGLKLDKKLVAKIMGEEKLELDEFNNALLQKLKKTYEPLRDKNISTSNANGLIKLMNKFTDKDDLMRLYKADIPFISVAASNRLISKFKMSGAELVKLRKEEVELEEALLEFKKGDIVIPNIGPHKGVKHEIIHDFKDGTYNIKPDIALARNIKYRMGAARAKASEIVKEELNEMMDYAIIDGDNKIIGLYKGSLAKKHAELNKSGAERQTQVKKPVKVVPVSNKKKGDTIMNIGEETVPANVKKIAKELDKAVAMHKSQAQRLRKAGVSEEDKLDENSLEDVRKRLRAKKIGVKTISRTKDKVTHLYVHVNDVEDAQQIVKNDPLYIAGKLRVVAKEEVEINEEVADIHVKDKVGSQHQVQIALTIKALANKLGLRNGSVGPVVRVMGPKNVVNQLLGSVIGKSSMGNASQKGTIPKDYDKSLNKQLREEVELKEFSSQQIKQAYGIANDSRYKQGNMSGAVNAIEKIAKGLSKHPDVRKVLQRTQEEVELDEGTMSGAAKDLEKMARDDKGSMDEKTYIKMAKLMKQGNLKQISDYFGKLDTEPREQIAMTLRKNVGKKKAGDILQVSFRESVKNIGAKNLVEAIAGLQKKADKSGMPYSILKKVFDRGMAAWKGGHRPGASQHQWAFARVNSFITKSSGTWGGADKDLAAKVRSK